MDKSEALNIARKYAILLKRNYETKRVILFGSYVRGNYYEESDIDIAVVLSDFDNSFDLRLNLMKLRREIDSRIEPHPFRESDFNASNPIAYEIIKYGQDVEFENFKES